MSFDGALGARGIEPLRRGPVRTLQVNVGKRCNQACHHCHVDAGPKRTESMTRRTARRVIDLLARSPGVETLDITGGAPELNPNFAYLVERARALGRRVSVRCNLTVFYESEMQWVPEFLRDRDVEVISSLPCYTPENVNRQRGAGVFEKSIEALRWLNRLGFGVSAPKLELSLVYNPLGPSLPPEQATLEQRYREELGRGYDIKFDRLLTITNMPIKRFAAQLERSGEYAAYMKLLMNHFNPATIPGLMCRTLLSVDWMGTLYDCDFNQMLEMPLRAPDGKSQLTICDVDELSALDGMPIATGPHCFGCSAGAGSSCKGALQ